MGETRLTAGAILVLALWTSPSYGAKENHPCGARKAHQAERAIDNLTSWNRLYRWYLNYGECDDGSIAEGYSEAVARNLVDRWGTLPRFAELARKDSDFQRFVLKHIDQTLNDTDLKKISKNAATYCPTGLRRLCVDLRKQAEVH